MLTINVVLAEDYDEERNLFIPQSEYTLELEHSLATLSKWESKWEKPFLSDDDKSREEVLWYVKAMTLDPNVPPEVFSHLSNENMTTINEYIEAKMTATTFNERIGMGRPSHEIITAEIIYYLMAQFQIPFECEHWHLNRLMALIKVCNIKNTPPKKMSQQEALQHQAALNDARRAKYGTTG